MKLIIIGSMVHTYNTRLSLEGIGTNEYRNINFYVTGPVDVYVVAKSSLVNDVRDRTLILSNNINAENIIDSKVINYGDLYKLEYTGTKAQRLYLASQLDNIYIILLLLQRIQLVHQVCMVGIFQGIYLQQII